MKILFLTTKLRPKLAKASLESLKKTVGDKAEIIICEDKKLEGHVFNFNKSLSKIGFDDDIVKCDNDLFYPDGWYDKFLEEMDEETAVCMGRNGVDWGCLMMIPKEVLRKVGYMNEEYGKYGYADCSYRARIKVAANLKFLELDFKHDEETGIIEKIPEKLSKEREKLTKKNRGLYDYRMAQIWGGERPPELFYKKYTRP